MTVTLNQLTRRCQLFNNTAEMSTSLIDITRKLFTWFTNNQMNANHNKVLFFVKNRRNKHRHTKNNNRNPHIYKKIVNFHDICNKLTIKRFLEIGKNFRLPYEVFSEIYIFYVDFAGSNLIGIASDVGFIAFSK